MFKGGRVGTSERGPSSLTRAGGWLLERSPLAESGRTRQACVSLREFLVGQQESQQKVVSCFNPST